MTFRFSTMVGMTYNEQDLLLCWNLCRSAQTNVD